MAVYQMCTWPSKCSPRSMPKQSGLCKLCPDASERVDSDDKNGVNVKISNTSVLPVYIKVADDDSSSPRFKLGEKSGTVKVY